MIGVANMQYQASMGFLIIFINSMFDVVLKYACLFTGRQSTEEQTNSFRSGAKDFKEHNPY